MNGPKRGPSREFETVHLPRQLRLAETWARRMGHLVAYEHILLPDNSKEVVIKVGQGSHWVLVRRAADGVKVFAIIVIPPNMRETLGALPADARRSAMDSLIATLASRQRTGWILSPSGVTDPGALEGIEIKQVLRLSPDDPGCINWLEDAIQEVTIATLITILSLQAATRGSGSRAAGDEIGEGPVPPGSGMYR